MAGQNSLAEIPGRVWKYELISRLCGRHSRREEGKEKNMAEKLLVTQALDERDLLVKRIGDKIARASFVDIKKNNEDTVYGARTDQETFARDARSAYQQILDLIARFQKIDAAIVASNASTKIVTSYGEFTVAGAISLRNRLRGQGTYKNSADFEGALLRGMETELRLQVEAVEAKNRQLNTTAENMRLSILGKDSKVKDDKPLEVVDAYVRENTTVLVDPLEVQKQIEALKEKRETLLRELDTQIKVSNATTYVEF